MESLIPLEPLGDIVIVSPLTELPRGANGRDFWLPPMVKASMAPQRGVVIAVGPGAVNDDGERVPPNVREGTLVAMRRNSGTDVSYGGVPLTMLRAEDVWAEIID